MVDTQRGFSARQAACLLLCALSVGCASEEKRSERRMIPLVEARSEASSGGGWLNVKTLQLNLDVTKPEPKDMIIRGTIAGLYFTPSGDIEGDLQEPPSKGKLERGWLSIQNRTLYLQKHGVAPTPPFLPGRYDTATELFYPDQREVVRTAMTIDVPATAPAEKP